jgi:hypothetical protein
VLHSICSTRQDRRDSSRCSNACTLQMIGNFEEKCPRSRSMLNFMITMFGRDLERRGEC